MSINNSYQVYFSTVKQLLHKLSSETIKNQLRASLESVKKEKNDLYNTHNYLLTLRQLLNIARSYVDEELDTQALDKCNYRNQDKNNINIKRTQDSSPKRHEIIGANLTIIRTKKATGKEVALQTTIQMMTINPSI